MPLQHKSALWRRFCFIVKTTQETRFAKTYIRLARLSTMLRRYVSMTEIAKLIIEGVKAIAGAVRKRPKRKDNLKDILKKYEDRGYGDGE